jgi:hypothetical protein
MRAVLPRKPHRHKVRSDAFMPENKKPDKTIIDGGTIIHIFSPPPQTDEEKDKILNEFHTAGWNIIDELIAQGKEV